MMSKGDHLIEKTYLLPLEETETPDAFYDAHSPLRGHIIWEHQLRLKLWTPAFRCGNACSRTPQQPHHLPVG